MSCTTKIKNTCGERYFATCVYYENALPAISELTQEDCYTLEEIVGDVYGLLEEITSNQSTSGLGLNCIDYPTTAGEIKLSDAIVKLEEEICNLKTQISELGTLELCNTPLEGCGLDLGTLTDQCSNPITTFGELLQALIDTTQTP